jgi:chemotaxis protein MotA
VGTVLISTPPSTLRALLRELPKIFKGSGMDGGYCLDVLKMLYELFQLARKDGVIAVEGHIERPAESRILSKYPRFLANHHAVDFFCDAMRTVIGGSVSPMDLDMALEAEIDVHHDESHKVVSVLSRVADGLPAIGIVAAVLGIVVTMQSLAGPIEEIGHHVAAALVGTFLGILLAYGLIAPLASNLESAMAEESVVYGVLRAGVVAFAKNLPPIVAAEFARKALTAEYRPSFAELEEACRSTRGPAA